MSSIPLELLELGTLGIVCLFFISKFFSYLRNRKNGGSGIEKEVKLIGSNHLNSIKEAITDGNKEIVKAISDGNLKIVESLGEIKGHLNK